MEFLLEHLATGMERPTNFLKLFCAWGLETFLAPKFLHYFYTSVHFDKLCFLL